MNANNARERTTEYFNRMRFLQVNSKLYFPNQKFNHLTCEQLDQLDQLDQHYQEQKGMKKKKNANRQPSGFVKPTRITDELADFLEKPHGIEIARTQVTREINTYIRAHSLATGRNINPDAKLMGLLKIPGGEILTYFNLQKYLSPHFYKNGFKNPEGPVGEQGPDGNQGPVGEQGPVWEQVKQCEELKQNSLREEMKQMREEMNQMRKEMEQINRNLEELTKRKLSVTEYFANRVKS